MKCKMPNCSNEVPITKSGDYKHCCQMPFHFGLAKDVLEHREPPYRIRVIFPGDFPMCKKHRVEWLEKLLRSLKNDI